MSFGHHEDCEKNQELEIQSVLASSCSGHELQSNCSDDACSQSEISLSDDGGSEEDGVNILTQLVKGNRKKIEESREDQDSQEDAMRAGDSYDCEEDEGYSLL